MSSHHRRRNKSYNEPGHAHELTFSCIRRLPLLSRDRTRQWFVGALDAARRRLQPWSSAAFYAGVSDVILAMDPLMEWLGA